MLSNPLSGPMSFRLDEERAESVDPIPHTQPGQGELLFASTNSAGGMHAHYAAEGTSPRQPLPFQLQLEELRLLPVQSQHQHQHQHQLPQQPHQTLPVLDTRPMAIPSARAGMAVHLHESFASPSLQLQSQPPPVHSSQQLRYLAAMHLRGVDARGACTASTLSPLSDGAAALGVLSPLSHSYESEHFAASVPAHSSAAEGGYTGGGSLNSNAYSPSGHGLPALPQRLSSSSSGSFSSSSSSAATAAPHHTASTGGRGRTASDATHLHIAGGGTAAASAASSRARSPNYAHRTLPRSNIISATPSAAFPGF